MNVRSALTIILIILVSLSCSPKPKKTSIAREEFEFELDPNTMTLVTYKLKGKTLPGKPKVVPARDSASALFERFGISFDIKQIDDKTWIGPLIIGDSYVIGWIAEDKKLFGYCSEPFTAAKDLEVTFSPGMPSTLEYDLTNPPKNIHTFPAVLLLQRKTISRGTETYLSWGINQKINEPRIVKIDGLAAGIYLLSVTVSDNKQYAKEREPFIFDVREVKIKNNTTKRLDAVYPEIDTRVEKNDITIRGTLYDNERKPLPGKMVQVIPYIYETKEQMLDLYYPKLKTNSNGKFEFVGVRPNITATVNSGFTSILLPKELMKKNACISLDLVLGSTTFPVEVDVPVQDLLVDWQDGGSGKLSDFIGKNVVVNFWAEWCGSCKEKVSELNSLASQLSEGEDVVFIEINVDFNRDTWEQMLDEQNWNQLRHAWLDLKKNSYILNKPLPYSLIIDKNGILRAAGIDLDVKVELEKTLEEFN
jgi:thiol-disulfide isomerase/thioredoxin